MGKCVAASVAGGAVYFVLGWIIYGFLVQDSGAAAEPVIWAIGLGSVFIAAVLALVLSWRGATGAGDAFKASAVFGVLLGLAIGFSLMGTMEPEAGPDLTAVIRDAVIGALMYGVAGVVVAKVLGAGGQAATEG